ncbi:hypothetical protein MRX96_001172 [Rhipicephalus microplus]
MWPHRPPPVGKRDLLRMMFHCDYTLGWSAVFRVDPELYQNATKAYVLTDSGFNFVVRKYNERSTEAHRVHYFSRLRNAFRDTEEAVADVVTFEGSKLLTPHCCRRYTTLKITLAWAVTLRACET